MKKAIDLFAGAGGFSLGAKKAGYNVVWASNHWQAAVDIHKANHPCAAHVCQDLHQANWCEVPSHDLMLASPACTGHTPARGVNQPHHDAARSTAWAPVSCAEVHRPYAALIENVPAFGRWVLWRAWCAAWHALGYSVSPHILDAADLGVPQHRVRLVVVCTRSKHPLALDMPKLAHIPASRIVDFNTGRWSKIDKPGRAVSTLHRAAAGRRAHGDRFVMPYYGSGSGKTGRSLNRPLGTVTTHDRWALVDGDRMRMLTIDENRAASGFPAGYKLPSDSKQALFMLGNSFPPAFAESVIRALDRAL
ncbi:MAG TPA: DNA cytosine methyltransferase [Usitatibacteraceae bacterium]